MAKNVIEIKARPLALICVLFLLSVACAWPLWKLHQITLLEKAITQRQDERKRL